MLSFSMGRLAMALALAPSATALSPKDLFKEFEQQFNKSYSSVEERAKRLAVFIENLAEIAHMKILDSSAEYSHLTPFADWTIEEFAARNTLQSPASLFEGPKATLLDTSDLPEAFDWREQGAVNPVKNQAHCGSCWAFATVANIEGANFLTTKKLVSLSEQELVDCDTVDNGCHGGLPANAYKDMLANNIGLETESAYPYKAANGQCQASRPQEKVFISDWKAISTDEDQIAAALIKYGPLSIGINAGPMQFYKGGLANPSKIACNPRRLDHGVAIVGFGQEQGTKYWVIRNSWGPSFGEQGYYRIIRGTGACGLNTNVATAIVGDSKMLVV